MLPPFIIEQIRQREEQKRWDEQPRLELPLDDFGSEPSRRGDYDPRRERRERGQDEPERGIVIIDL